MIIFLKNVRIGAARICLVSWRNMN